MSQGPIKTLISLNQLYHMSVYLAIPLSHPHNTTDDKEHLLNLWRIKAQTTCFFLNSVMDKPGIFYPWLFSQFDTKRDFSMITSSPNVWCSILVGDINIPILHYLLLLDRILLIGWIVKLKCIISIPTDKEFCKLNHSSSYLFCCFPCITFYILKQNNL